MLSINTEIRKGILFVRLVGDLNKHTVDTFNEEVTSMVKDNGISNIVFNFNELNAIDMKGINALFYNYELVNNNNGKTLICNMSNNRVKHRINNSRLLNYMNEVSDELTAFNTFNL